MKLCKVEGKQWLHKLLKTVVFLLDFLEHSELQIYQQIEENGIKILSTNNSQYIFFFLNQLTLFLK